jgi:hypothetical protein
MAGVEGLEPAALGFGDRCSSQLSYTPTSLSIVANESAKNYNIGDNQGLPKA